MNSLDDLLSSAGRVPEFSDEGMGKGLQSLRAAIAQANAEQTPTQRKALPRWRAGWRGMMAVGATAAVGAAAVVTAAVTLPSPATPSKTAPQAAPAARATGF